jgi:hypothetical protein
MNGEDLTFDTQLQPSSYRGLFDHPHARRQSLHTRVPLSGKFINYVHLSSISDVRNLYRIYLLLVFEKG